MVWEHNEGEDSQLQVAPTSTRSKRSNRKTTYDASTVITLARPWAAPRRIWRCEFRRLTPVEMRFVRRGWRHVVPVACVAVLTIVLWYDTDFSFFEWHTMIAFRNKTSNNEDAKKLLMEAAK